MTKTKYNLELLEQCITRDNAKLEKDYSNISLNRDLKIEFSCSCGRTNCIKTFRQLYENSGLFCKKCTHNNGWAKKKETSIEKYGVEHPFQNETIKAKIKETCREKYGGNTPMASKTVKAKIKETCIEKYGVDCSLQSESIKAKIKETNIEKYGVEHPSQSKTIKTKIKEICIEKYGGDSPMTSETIKAKSKETCKEKYGYEHACQNPTIAERQSKNAYKRKEIITPSGQIIYMQGYEPFAYKILLDTYSEIDIINNRTEVPEIWWVDTSGKNHRYYVDFYIPKDNLLIEVKSKRTYTLDDKKEKIEKTLEVSFNKGFNTELWVIGNKGEIVEKIIKHH